MSAEKRKSILFTSSAPHIAGGEINLLALLDTINTVHFAPYCLYHPSSHFGEHISRKGVRLCPFIFPTYKKGNLPRVTFTIIYLMQFLFRHEIKLVYINVPQEFKFFAPISAVLRIPTILHVHINEPDDSLRWIRADRASRILFPSRATMRDVLKHSPWIDAGKCFYVHNAVDLSRFYPRSESKLREELGIRDELPIIGVVGQLKKIKGQELFLESVKRLRDTGIEGHFLIVGDDNIQAGKYSGFLEQKAIDLGIDDCILFLGYRKDVPEIMSLLDLLVVPSLKEPFGRVVIEAMACGTPVIASAVDGIPEIFKSGEGGLFFKPGSVSELTEKVKYFFDNPRWWHLQKRKAYEHCKKNFAQEIHTKKIEQHISQIIQSRECWK